LILREFDEQLLEAEVALLRRVIDEVTASEPRVRADLKLTEQYRNMRAYVEGCAVRPGGGRAGDPRRGDRADPPADSGGTDGSQL